jgi:hypothetical protein
LSLTFCVVLPLPAILWRIHVEEAALNHVLGEAIPHVSVGQGALDPTALVSTNTDLRWNETSQVPRGIASGVDGGSLAAVASRALR